MATPTREEVLVQRKIKHLNESINYALADIEAIDVQGRNSALLQTSYVNYLPKIRGCKAYLKDAKNLVKDIPY